MSSLFQICGWRTVSPERAVRETDMAAIRPTQKADSVRDAMADFFLKIIARQLGRIGGPRAQIAIGQHFAAERLRACPKVRPIQKH
jgi:hypothetical protein